MLRFVLKSDKIFLWKILIKIKIIKLIHKIAGKSFRKLERQKEIEQIKNKISELEQQDKEIQAQIQEALKLTREANSEEMGDVHSYGNFLDRVDYEVERLSEQSYNLNVEISGLEFKLSKLEEN